MRRRASGSTEEDDSDQAATPDPPPQPGHHGAGTTAVTTAKCLVAPPSDALDRRKGDRGVSPLSVAEEAWTAEPVSYHGADAKRYTVAGSPGQPWTNPAMDLGEQRRPRVRSPWKLSLLTLATTALSCFLLAAIVHSYASRQVDTKGCNGVQMRPAFAKFTGFDTEHTRFASKYSLWLYREQYIDLDAIVKGVPVLFITGNAGSFKQVRALAAEAATYFHEYVRHDPEALRLGVRSLDFFTADFNEDLTAFHGQTLLDQAEYLNDAVAYILSLYHDPERSNRDPGLPDPTSVIIIGHSMGGVVARTMLAMPNYQANSINTILTLSAPHARPPASFDAQIVKTYRNVNDYWRQAYSQKWANNNPLWHVTLISIAGGGLDTVVPSDYASISSLVPDTHGFTVFTSSIQDVWTGADHLAITWCDQLRKVIVKALLETTNVYRSSQTKPRADRMRIFKKWFLTGMEEMAERTLPHKEPETLLTLPDNSDSILAAGERLTIRNFGHSGKPTAHILPIPPMSVPGEKKFTLLSDQPLDASGASGKLEVLFCSVFPLQPGQSVAFFPVNIDLSGASAGTTRLACKNAASDVIHLPTSNRTSRYPFNGSRPLSYLQYKLEDLTEHQFVAVVDKGQGQSDGWAIAEFSDNADSRIKMDVGLRRLLATGLRLTLPAERPMVTEVKIPAIHSSLFAYKLRVGVQACGDETALFTPLLRQYVSEPYESKYFVNVKEADINVHGISPFMPPALGGTTVMDGVSLQLWSDPTCNTSVEVHLQADIPGSMGKLVMRYRTAFLAFPLLIVALVLRKQFMVHDVTGVFMTFSEALDLCLRSSLPALVVALSFFALSIASASNGPGGSTSNVLQSRTNSTIPAVDYAKNDLLLGAQDPFFWFLVPLFGLLAAGMCVVVNYLALAIIFIFCFIYTKLGSTASWFRGDDRRRNHSAFSVASPRRRLITTCILLLLVSTIIPYQFAYLVGCIVQLATCTRALRLVKDSRSRTHYNFFNYAHAILILMLWVLPVNLPVLVVWVHNLAIHWLTPFSSHHNVLSIMPFILLVETLASGRMIPRVFTRFRHVTNVLLFVLAIYAAIYGVTYGYQLHYLANIVATWLVAVHFACSTITLQGLSQMLGEESEEGDVKKRP